MRRIFFILIICAAFAPAGCSGAGDQRGRAVNENTGEGSSSHLEAASGESDPAGQTASVSARGEQQLSSDGDAVGATSDPAVSASADEVAIRAGGSATTFVRLNIAEGYHVNANPPSSKFLIGTQLEVAAAEGVTPGRPRYPAPVNKNFSFDPKPLAVYEGAAAIGLPLRAEGAAAKGRRTLTARILVQPCNDRACLPPRTVETSIPVTIN